MHPKAIRREISYYKGKLGKPCCPRKNKAELKGKPCCPVRHDLEKKLEEKEWALKHHNETDLKEYMLQNPFSVHSLMRKGDLWTAKIWMSKTRLAEEKIDADLVEYLVGDLVMKKERFNKGVFCQLKKYDLLAEIEETFFKSITQIYEDTFELMDSGGEKCRVRESWFDELPNISVEDVVMAKLYFQQFNNSTKPLRAPRSVFMTAGTATDAVLTLNACANMPEIVYTNSKGPGRKPRCLAFSVANALHYLNLKKAAEAVATSSLSRHQHLRKFFWLRGRPVKSWDLRIGKSRYDPLNRNHWRRNPVLVEMKAKKRNDAGMMEKINVNHCVCFVDGLIFDPNQSHALPITRESLDHVVASIVDGAVFGGFHWTREICVFGNIK